MTEAEMAQQLVFPGHKFGIDDPEEALLLAEMGVGGFCLYGGLPAEVAAFTAALQARAPRPLIFNADYEDGVSTQCPGGTELPSNMGIGASRDETIAENKGAITAAEARAMGVCWVLAPVCDLATAADNPIVNVRSFSSDPELVASLARAYLRGLRSQGVMGCIKHFPGHGETLEDSHLRLPRLDVPKDRLLSRELAPFRALAREAESVMTGHLVVPALGEPVVPYSISADVAKTLRGELGFEGLVSTDALNMRAIAENFDELDASLRALRGGSDVLLVPSRPRELLRSLAAAVAEDITLHPLIRAAYQRLETARGRIAAVGQAPPVSEVGCEPNAQTAQRLADACVAWAWDEAVARLPASISYWEPEVSPPDEWLGAAFVEGLRSAGVKVKPHVEGGSAEKLVIGSFLNPRAYTGRIRYDDDEQARVRKELANCRGAVIVSFGSPFVYETFGVGGPCVFSKNGPAQRTAAKVLTGALAVGGKMPVALRRPR